MKQIVSSTSYDSDMHHVKVMCSCSARHPAPDLPSSAYVASEVSVSGSIWPNAESRLLAGAYHQSFTATSSVNFVAIVMIRRSAFGSLF